jgi:hypothetical protein
MSETIWNLFVELRKELLEAQKIRSQVLGFKFTFVSAAVGLLVANIENINSALFVLPAFAAICFDFIIYSYSFSIKRIGCYTRDYIEPALRSQGAVPKEFVMWQKFLTQPKTKQNLAMFGNMGVTILAVLIGMVALFNPFNLLLSPALILALLLFLVLDYMAYRSPKKLA